MIFRACLFLAVFLCMGRGEVRAEIVSGEDVFYDSVTYEPPEPPQVASPVSVKVLKDEFESSSNQTHMTYSCSKPTILPLVCSVRGRLNLNVSSVSEHHGLYDLYEDQACTKEINSVYNRIFEKKTYYLMLDPSIYGSTYSIDMSLYSMENTTMKQGKWTVGCTVQMNNPSASPYHKIVVKKKGYIIVNGNIVDGPEYAVTLRLCNSKKKPISSDYPKTIDSHYKGAYFAVQPGTYYLQSTILSELTPYRLKYTFKTAPKVKNVTKGKGGVPASEISKTAKKKAATLKKNKRTPLVYYKKGSSMKYHRWYKIKVKKKQKITVYMGTTWVTPDIFDTKGRRVPTITHDSGSQTLKKVKPGTYYIEAPACFEKLPKKHIGLVRILYWK